MEILVYNFKGRFQAVDGDGAAVTPSLPSRESTLLEAEAHFQDKCELKIRGTEWASTCLISDLKSLEEHGCEVAFDLAQWALENIHKCGHRSAVEKSKTQAARKKRQIDQLKALQERLRLNIGMPVMFDTFSGEKAVKGRIKGVVLHRRVPTLLYKIELLDGSIVHKRTNAELAFDYKSNDAWAEYDRRRAEAFQSSKQIRAALSRLKKTEEKVEALLKKVEQDRRDLDKMMQDIKLQE